MIFLANLNQIRNGIIKLFAESGKPQIAPAGHREKLN
jgi:hypothetical protein